MTGPAGELDAWLRELLTGLLQAAQALDIKGEAIARCEAELAILGEHASEKATFSGDGWGPHDFGCRTCACVEYGTAPEGWCKTVRLLGTGYAGRPGYQQEWAP